MQKRVIEERARLSGYSNLFLLTFSITFSNIDSIYNLFSSLKKKAGYKYCKWIIFNSCYVIYDALLTIHQTYILDASFLKN